MMPVLGDSSAAVHCRLGSMAIASAALSSRMPSTPLASARPLISVSFSLSASLVATISLPQLRCGTPCSAHVGIEQAPAGDAGARHQAALGIVDAGVDDFGIPRAGLGADAFGRLDDDDLTAGKGKGAGDGEADDTCADHNAVDGFERGRSHGRMLVDWRDWAGKKIS